MWHEDFSEFSEEVSMSTQLSGPAMRIEQLTNCLQARGYSAKVQRHYLPVARRFLGFLVDRRLSVETARSCDLEDFVRKEYRAYRKSHRHAPPSKPAWRAAHTAAPLILLRLVHTVWPPELPA